MKSEAIVMTFDFGSNYFNAIVLNNQVRLISCKGTIMGLPGKDPKPLIENSVQEFNRLTKFFKAGNAKKLFKSFF